MKATIYKGKFIVVKPTPRENITNGLRIKTTGGIDRLSQKETMTDINAGQKIYELPKIPRNIITGVFISLIKETK